MTAATLVLNRIEKGEDARTAFFAGVGDAAQLARTLCAFLNDAGGVVLCGVNDNGEVVGVPKTVTKKAAKQLELYLKEQLTPVPLLHVTVESVGDKRVLMIEVPAGTDRPYVFDDAVWVRKDTATRVADAHTLRALVKSQADTPVRWERRLSPSLGVEDLDKREVKSMASIAVETDRFKFQKEASEQEILREVSLWSPEGFTQGADLLFSKAPWRRHPQCRVQWVEFASDKVGDAYADQVWLQGPMVRVCREVFDKFAAINKVRTQFRQNSAQRADTLMYSSQALREGIVNALVHRDYTSYSGGTKVSVFPDRIEIWNSGRLPDGLKTSDLRKDHPSILINPDITQVFYITGLMEGIGRGTQKIVAESRELGSPTPVWKDAPTGVTLTIYAAGAGGEPVAVELNGRQNAFLAFIEVGGTVSLSEYRRSWAPEITERQARRDLTELVELGELQREGRGPSTTYRRVRNDIRT